MDLTKTTSQPCLVCHKVFAPRDLISGGSVRETVAQEIQREYPDWTAASLICRADLNKYRSRYVHSLLESREKWGHSE